MFTILYRALDIELGFNRKVSMEGTCVVRLGRRLHAGIALCIHQEGEESRNDCDDEHFQWIHVRSVE